MQPARARLEHTTSHIVPHLGGVAASIGTFSCADVYTLARACASALVLWRKNGVNHLYLNQYVDPASLWTIRGTRCLTQLVQSFFDPARLLKPAGSKNI